MDARVKPAHDECHDTTRFPFRAAPNGYLHLGHALSALIDFEMARAMGGRFLLRIEDIDPTRCRPEFETAIYEDLAWLGIAWEEPVRRQSGHLDAYQQALAKLEAEGLVYPSFESRGEIAQYVAEHRTCRGRAIRTARRSIPGYAKKLGAGGARSAGWQSEPYALRLDMNAAVARTGALTWVETGADPKQDHETLMARAARSGATSCSPARTRRRAIISRWWWTMPCRA